MKILIDARMYGLEHSGIGRYLINLIGELTKLETKKNFAVLLRKKYFNQLNLPLNWKKVLADFKHYGFREQLELPRIINREKPDLVHFPHLNIPIFSKERFVVTVHDLTMQRQGISATSLPTPVYYLKRVAFLLIARTAVKNSVKIIVPSRYVKKDVVNYYSVNPDKIEVIYEGIGRELSPSLRTSSSLKIPRIFKKYRLQEAKYFFYVGNAYPHKNLELAIRATTLLNKTLKDRVIFVIAGVRDVFKDRLERFIKNIGAGRFVRLVGFIPDEELAVFYKNSVAFLYPSLSEGFGLQGLEAMRLGTLVLASNIPVFKEIYGSFAFYFNPKDVLSLTKSMRFLLNLDEKKRETFIKKSQKFIERYSWKKMAKETLEVYNQALVEE